MARPQKVGVEYFPLDVDIDQDDKVAMVEALHGLKGFAIVVKLLMKIYKEGYYCEWTEREQILFARRVNVDINEVNVIINDSVKWGLFDEDMFNEHQILTSKGIQARYLEIVKRRKEVEVINGFLLVSENLLINYKNIVIVDINGVIADINPENVDNSTQSKVKKSKVKESIVKKEEAENISSNIASIETVGNLIDNDISRIAIEFQQSGFGTINISVKEMLEILLKEYGVEWILEAMKVAVKSNKRSLKYVEGILQNWRRDGGMKLESDKKTTTSPKHKTRFHNFEQRTDKYSSDQLDTIAKRKREAHSENLRKQKEQEEYNELE